MVRALPKAWVLIAALAAAACAAPRIDSSTPEKLAASIQKASATLPTEQREKFAAAIMTVSLKDVAGAGIMALAAQSPAQLQASASVRLNGKTAAEIIAEAEAIHAERAAKEREQAIKEIAELEVKMAGALAARADLAKFVVSSSRFRRVPQTYGSDKPLIDMVVKNGTPSAISRAYFRGTVASPGRSVPWIKEDFNYEIAGGLEPGESVTWSLGPNSYGPWGRVETPRDAILTVEVIKLDGPDGKMLYDSDFSDRDRERLETLKKSFQ